MSGYRLCEHGVQIYKSGDCQSCARNFGDMLGLKPKEFQPMRERLNNYDTAESEMQRLLGQVAELSSQLTAERQARENAEESLDTYKTGLRTWANRTECAEAELDQVKKDKDFWHRLGVANGHYAQSGDNEIKALKSQLLSAQADIKEYLLTRDLDARKRLEDFAGL